MDYRHMRKSSWPFFWQFKLGAPTCNPRVHHPDQPAKPDTVNRTMPSHTLAATCVLQIVGSLVLYTVSTWCHQSRCRQVVTTSHPHSGLCFYYHLDSILVSVVLGYAEDPHAKEMLSKLALDPTAVPNFTLNSGLLRYRNHVWISQDLAL
jgi:hypothetical protein